jgi:hypothetical protein
MKAYKVLAVYEVELETTVEAENEDEAWEKANDSIDGGDYVEVSRGNWRVYDVYEHDVYESED